MVRGHVKVHVEVDADPPAYRQAVVYLTLAEPLEGVELHLRLREGVAVTDCWPRWPDRMSEREAVWLATLYPRWLEEGLFYSFGARMGLQGMARLTIEALKWEVEGRAVVLEVERRFGLRAVVGPLMPGFKVLSSYGQIGIAGEVGARYVVVEGGAVSLKLEPAGQSIVAGFLEYEPLPVEMPFDVEVKGLANPTFECRMVVRLRDIKLA